MSQLIKQFTLKGLIPMVISLGVATPAFSVLNTVIAPIDTVIVTQGLAFPSNTFVQESRVTLTAPGGVLFLCNETSLANAPNTAAAMAGLARTNGTTVAVTCDDVGFGGPLRGIGTN